MQRADDDDDVIVVSHTCHPSPTPSPIDLTTTLPSPSPPFPIPAPHYSPSWSPDGRTKRLAVDLTLPIPATPPLTLSQLSSTLTLRPPLRRKRRPPPPPPPSSLPPSHPLLPPPLPPPPHTPSPPLPPRIDHLSHLPTDLLKELLSYLDGAEAFFAVTSLSSLFHRLTLPPSPLLSSPTFDFSPFAALLRPSLLRRCLASTSPSPTHTPHTILRVSLASCASLPSSTLTSALTPLTCLTHLNLSHTSIHPADVGVVATHCRLLEDLRVDLSARPRHSPPLAALSAVFALPALRLLDVAGWGITDTLMLGVEGGGGVGREGGTGLTHVSLHHNPLGNHSLLQVPWLLSPQLVYLDLSHTSLSSGLFALHTHPFHPPVSAGALRLPHLRYLNIATTAHSSLLTQDVVAILQGSPLLSHLNLSGHTQVASLTPSACGHPPSHTFPHLLTLALSRCWRIRHSALAAIPLHFPSLTSLTLDEVQLGDADVLALAEASVSVNTCGHRLRVLELHGNVGVTTASVVRVMEVMEGLRVLGVGGCSWVEEEGLTEWVRRRRGKGRGMLLPSPGLSYQEDRQRQQARRRWEPPLILRSDRASTAFEGNRNRMDEVT